jgi:DNA-binding transcriptional MerR regulator
MRQDNKDDSYYGIEELAELGGVTRRTVRYYVQRGLLPTPLGTGRGPHYTAAHLQRLIHIRTLQEAGVPLAEVAARLDGVPHIPVSAPEVLPERSAWMRFVLADGVELHVRAGVANFLPSQLARLVEVTRQTLGIDTVPHPSARSKSHARNSTQLSDDTEPHPDPAPGRTP